jgi:hypothetical protein
MEEEGGEKEKVVKEDVKYRTLKAFPRSYFVNCLNL